MFNNQNKNVIKIGDFSGQYLSIFVRLKKEAGRWSGNPAFQESRTALGEVSCGFGGVRLV